MKHRPLVHAAAALTAVVALAGCARPGAADTAEPAAPLGRDPGVAHVHGLGVDPADGVLYAASHYGLFRIPPQGVASRVADRFQDTMGFTVIGPNTFLGSGHPDVQKDPDLPPRLGLIRSTDAAQTWQGVSLSGEADFHALHAAHGNVYGWDSTSSALLVSADDGRTWDARSTVELRDFAVDPADPEALLGTTEQGLVRSADGGRTWQTSPGAPLLAVLSWPAPGRLFGVTPDGTVQQSADGGRSWTARGSAGGAPEALTVDDRDGARTVYVAVRDRGILASVDDGASFTTRYSA